MISTKSGQNVEQSTAAKRQGASLAELTEPYVSRREVFPARHLVTGGVSPWQLGRDSRLLATVSSLTWSVISYAQTLPVGDGSVVATETQMIVEVVAVKGDGTTVRMDDCECVLRTELDSRSLADRQLTGQGWLLPIGYSVTIEAPLV